MLLARTWVWNVTFKRVNRASGYQLEEPEELELVSRKIVAVAKSIPESKPFSPQLLTALN